MTDTTTQPDWFLDACAHSDIFGLCPHAWKNEGQHGACRGVMLWRCTYCGEEELCVDCVPSRFPHYSSDMGAAWLVVDHITSTDGPFADQKWSFGLEYSTVIDWVADFTPRRNHPKARDYPAYQAGGSTAAEAICKAALLAVRAMAPGEAMAEEAT